MVYLFKVMKKSHFYIVAFTLLTINISAQEQAAPKSDWNGYTQLRAYSNFADNSGFMLRRMKLWLKSTPDFSEHWSYKIQTTITSLQQEKFFLQDVKLSYKTGLFSFDLGQFVPAYSLQWSQPDWKIPSIERAKVIDRITPSGSLGVRDLGAQANFATKSGLFETHLGLFNGYGIKEYQFNNQGYMFTNKSSINIPVNKNKIQLGYSVLYRKADSLKIPHVLADTVVFTGNDFRYNFFARFESRILDIQAEYLNANLENSMSDGYYILTTIKMQKSQIVLSYEKYNDLILETNDAPYIHLGYNFLFNKQKLMLYFDNSAQIINNNIENYVASVQLQIFFK